MLEDVGSNVVFFWLSWEMLWHLDGVSEPAPPKNWILQIGYSSMALQTPTPTGTGSGKLVDWRTGKLEDRKTGGLETGGLRGHCTRNCACGTVTV